MAQQKVVDYDLLGKAGYAAHMEKPRAEKSFWTEFLDMGAKYLDHTKAKTDALIAAMPEVDIAKVDEKMMDMTTTWLSEQRDIIVKASSDMAFYGSTSKKGREAVNAYNLASAAIVNYNKSLTFLQGEVKYALENPNLGNEVSAFDAANHHDFANGTVYDKITRIDSSGNIFWQGNGTMKVDDGKKTNTLVEVPIGEQKITDRKRSNPYNSDAGSTWNTYIHSIRLQKTKTNKESRLGEVQAVDLGQINTFVQSLTTPNQVVGFMYNERSLNGELFIDKFISNSIEEGGLGIDEDTNPELYKQLLHDLKDGNWEYKDKNDKVQQGTMKKNLDTFLRDDAQDAWDALTENLPEKVKDKKITKETPQWKQEKAAKLRGYKADYVTPALANEDVDWAFDPDDASGPQGPGKYVWRTTGDTFKKGSSQVEVRYPADGWYLLNYKLVDDDDPSLGKGWMFVDENVQPDFPDTESMLDHMRISGGWNFTANELGY